MNSKFLESFQNIELAFHGVRLPEFFPTKEDKEALKLESSSSNFDFLRALALQGFKTKVNVKKDSEEYKKYIERAKYELEVFKKLGVVDYMLLVWDVMNFCEKSNIAVGLGRGSAAGSLILFLIGVTKIDSLKHGLYFQRFISETRAKSTTVDGITYLDGKLMPDIDNDISYYDRHKVVEYLQNKYPSKVAKIMTFNTYQGKLLIKECCKTICGRTEEEVNLITSIIPVKYGVVKDIEECYAEVPEFKSFADANIEGYNAALKLRGLIKNKGSHPSGYVVSYENLDEICPIEITSDKERVAGYDMNIMSSFCLKLDILGLRSASLVHDVCRKINIKPEEIDLTDPIIWDNLQNLITPHGIFQIEADTNFKVLKKVKPKNLNQLSAVLALARPGALDFVEQYSDYTNHGKYKSIHPFLDEILKDSGGVVLYQEQLMRMVSAVGFSLDEAETVRRIVGKKNVKEMIEWEDKIKNKVKENGIDEKVSEILWKVAKDSANYSFNFSHSLSYASLSAITVYLKFKYPKEFYSSLLNISRYEQNPIEEISKICPELQYFGIELLAPHLLKSELEFKAEGPNIRFGLLSIKGISDKSIEKLAEFKKEYKNKFQIYQGANQAGITIGVLSALIQAGALDEFGVNRTKIVREAQLWRILTDKEKGLAFNLAEECNFNLIKIINRLKETKDDKGKPLIKETRISTIKRRYQPYLDIYKLNSSMPEFTEWWYEKLLLGYSPSHDLTDIFRQDFKYLMKVEEVDAMEPDDKIHIVGQVIEAKGGLSKAKKTPFYRLLIKDDTKSITCMIFGERILNHEAEQGRKAKEGDIVYVRGKKMGDAIFADFINIQTQKIYTKLSQLKAGENKDSVE